MSKISLPVVITPTRVELGLRCHRRHVFADVLSKIRYYSPSLEGGSVIHAGAASHWLLKSGMGKLDPIEAVRTEYDKRFVQKNVEQKNFSAELAESMTRYYVENAKLAGPFEDEGWRLVDVEQRFEVPVKLPDGGLGIISFQMDRVVENTITKRLVIIDTKTAGRFDAKWTRQWETSIQMKLYNALAKRVFGRDDITVVIEGVLKHVPSEIKYVVCPQWGDAELGEALFLAQYVAERDRELILKGVTRNVMDKTDVKPVLRTKEEIENIAVQYTVPNYGDCFAYNVECPYFRICTANVDERLPILRGEYFEIPEEDETY